MSNFIRLVRLGLLNGAMFRNRSKKDIALIFLGLITIFIFVFILSNFFFKVAKGIEYIVILVGLLSFSILTIFSNINAASSYLFNFKDYDAVMSLPVSKSVVILSRIAIIYINNLKTLLMLLFPMFLAYYINVPFNLEFNIILLVILIFLPVVPMVIGSFLSIIVTYISSFFKSNKLLNMSVYFLFLGAYFYFYYQFTTKTPDIENVSNMLDVIIKTFNSKYPLAKYYTEALIEKNYLSLSLYVIISIIILYIFTAIIKFIYLKINTFLKTEKKNKNYNYKGEKVSQFKSLYTKEIKKITGSPIYLTNSLFGAIIMLVMTGYLIFGDSSMLVKFLKKELELNNFFVVMPLLLSFIIGMSCMTHSAISLEGKSFPLIKTFPITVKSYFDSKIFVNLVFNMIVLFIGVTSFNIVFKLNLALSIFNYIIPLLFSIFVIVTSLILNLRFPKFNFDNDAQVVKRSIPSFASAMIAMIIPMIIMKILDKINNVYFALTITLIVFAILALGSYIVLNTYGKKLFKELS